jgi:hypothetical protein
MEQSQEDVKICHNHDSPLVYPASYDVCPACDLEKSQNSFS